MCMLGTAISQLFFFKSNAPRFGTAPLYWTNTYNLALYLSFSSYFVILTTYPAGKWLARVLPDKRIYLYKWSFSLNPGEWNRKEHLLGQS